MSFEFFVQLLLNGVVIGLIYGLVATGLSLQFGILHIVNFAHGEFMMLAMYGMLALLPLFGGSFALAFVAMIFVSTLMGVLASRGLFAALPWSESEVGVFEKSLILTLGLSIILINGTQFLFTANPQMATTDIGFGGFDVGDVRLTYAHALAAVIAVITFIILFYFLMRTNAGRALRAVAQSREAAVMIGLDPNRIAGRAIVISIVLTMIAGTVLVPIIVFQPIVGQTFLLKAFAVVIIGGMGNVGGAVIVALGLGILESVIGGLTNVVWQNATAFIAMILVLVVRPNGLFSNTVRKG